MECVMASQTLSLDLHFHHPWQEASLWKALVTHERRNKRAGTESRRALMPSPQFPNRMQVKPKACCVLSRTGAGRTCGRGEVAFWREARARYAVDNVHQGRRRNPKGSVAGPYLVRLRKTLIRRRLGGYLQERQPRSEQYHVMNNQTMTEGCG